MEADGTFEELGLGVAVNTSSETVVVDLPQLASLRNNGWSWPSTIQPRDRLSEYVASVIPDDIVCPK